MLVSGGFLAMTMFRLAAWALEQVFDEIEAACRADAPATAAAVSRAAVGEALALYRGPFLADEEQGAFLVRREQLRARLLRSLSRIGRGWEESGRGAALVDAWQHCIDAAPECEAFHRNLMLCQQRQGDSLEALATYERLQAALAARSQAGPSAETQAVYARLRA